MRITTQVRPSTQEATRIVITPPNCHVTTDFAERHARQVFADRARSYITKIPCYEAGASAPILDVLRNIAIVLSVTIDSLLFNPDECGPQNALALAFEATQHLSAEEQATVRDLITNTIDALTTRNQLRAIHTGAGQ